MFLCFYHNLYYWTRQLFTSYYILESIKNSRTSSLSSSFWGKFGFVPQSSHGNSPSFLHWVFMTLYIPPLLFFIKIVIFRVVWASLCHPLKNFIGFFCYFKLYSKIIFELFFLIYLLNLLGWAHGFFSCLSFQK
jgi:hypothetical protein